MAEDRPVARGQHRRHPPAFHRQDRVADREHASMQAVEAPRSYPVVDDLVAHAELQQLAPRDDAVLCGGKGGDRQVGGAFS